MRTRLCILLALLIGAAAEAGVIRSGDGLALDARLPAAITALTLDRAAVGKGEGGFTLTDPRTRQAPPAGAFTLTARAAAERDRIVVSGLVRAAGEAETVCQLQAAIPVGSDGWLFWDNMSRARSIRLGETYEQPVYPLACVTSPDRQQGVAVALDPDPLQPASLSYDPSRHVLLVTWRLGFTPLARSEFRMQAPFKIELYRLQPGWAFRSALARYYGFHPRKFDWRARYEGLWEFATETPGLPNPQHYAYNEGGPPVDADRPRGIHTFPYTCTGDLIIPLPVEWGVPKTYEEMLDRLDRWSKLPRLTDWDALTDYTLVSDSPHGGKQALQYELKAAGGERSLRQTIVLAQKKPEPVTISVWNRSRDVTGGADSNYGLWADLLMTDGSFQFGKTAPAAVGTHDWQQLTLTVGGDRPIQEIRLYLLLRGEHTGTAGYDDLTVTTAGQPDKNLARTGDFESSGPPPQLQYLRDNVMHDQNDHMRYFADTFGGADVGPSSPINWLRFWTLVNPDQVNPEGRLTEAQKDLGRIAEIFEKNPECAGIYFDGTSACTTVTYEYRRDFFYCFRDPFMYEPGVNRVCANGMASVIRYVDEYKRRFPGKLAFGNVWASNRMFPMCMGLDVPGYESSRWYDLDYADYYRAALYHKPGPYLNYFRIGQQLDTREGGERFFRYATAYGIFPSIGRFTDEAYEKFGDLQHLYIPIVKHLFRAGWEPVTLATTADPEVRVQRFGSRLPLYFTVLNPTPYARRVRLAIEAASLPLAGRVVARDYATSAAVPLQREGGLLTAELPLGPQDVAVLALLPADGVAAWYRERAAEALSGAAFVYAQTPPTNASAALAARVRQLPSAGNAAATARTIAGIERDLRALERAADKLPADLKRVSYQRELRESRRLLDESLLADVRGEIGWQGTPVASSDETVQLAPAVQAPAVAEVQTGASTYAWGRLIEPDQAALQPCPAGLSLRSSGPEQATATVVTTVDFRDAAGRRVAVSRRGYGYFTAPGEIGADYNSAARTVSVRLHNLDSRPRQFRLQVAAPEGLTVAPAAAEASLAAGETRQFTFAAAFAPTVEGGSYPIRVSVTLPSGLPLGEKVVEVPYVLPLEPGDLALAGAGAQLAVDSAYYAYSEKPLNDGVVIPGGEAFNQSAWAAAETDNPHWIQITWPQPQRLARAVIYWNIENDTTWSSQQVQVQVKQGEGWQTVAEARPRAGSPVTTVTFDPVTASALRVLQPKGAGPATRPNIMWVREVAVYGK